MGTLHPQSRRPDGAGMRPFAHEDGVRGGLQAALCTRLLTGRPLETGRLYAADLLDMEMEGIARSDKPALEGKNKLQRIQIYIIQEVSP